MKKSYTNVIKALLSSVLAIGAGITAGAVSADPAGLTPGDSVSSNLILASTDFKGIHPTKAHVAFEQQSKTNPSAQVGVIPGATPVIFKGKPPYNRHIVKQEQLEKVQFSRFEEQDEATKHEHKMYQYHGAQGKRPPYKRNW